MRKVLTQVGLAITFIALTTVLLPVSNAVWTQTLSIGGQVSVAPLPTPTPTSTPTNTPTPTSTPTATPDDPDFTTTKVMVLPPQLQVPGQAGETVEAYVRLPRDTRAEQVDQSSLRMCVGSGPCVEGAKSVAPTQVAVIKSGEPIPAGFEGYDVLLLTFDRAAVLGLIDDPKPGLARFAVSGRLLVGTASAPARALQPSSATSGAYYLEFGGSDEVELLAAEAGTPTPTSTVAATPQPTATASVSSPTPAATPTPEVVAPSPTATPTPTNTALPPTAIPATATPTADPPSASPTVLPFATPTGTPDSSAS